MKSYNHQSKYISIDRQTAGFITLFSVCNESVTFEQKELKRLSCTGVLKWYISYKTKCFP